MIPMRYRLRTLLIVAALGYVLATAVVTAVLGFCFSPLGDQNHVQGVLRSLAG